jgi:Tol biopolymer transport system component
LEKNVERRLPDAKFARTQIEDATRNRTSKRSRLVALPLAAGALLAGAGLAAGLLNWNAAPRDQMLHAVPLTTYPGTQDWPSFSPDGSEVAFSWDGDRQDNLDIYVKRIGPEPPARLTSDPAPDRAPAWSPDGTAIAFLRGSQPGKAAVVLITPLGGPERVLTEVAVSGPNNQFLAWSPDSKWLAVSDRPAGQPPGLWLVSVKMGERRRLTTVPPGFIGDYNVAFAPDGSLLAFTRMIANNSFDLYALSLIGDLRPRSEPRHLTRENQLVGLAWAGRDLIISSGPPGNTSLFRIATSGTARRTRLTEQGEVLNLTISERARRMVFSQSRREMDIYRAELSAKGDAVIQSTPLIASSRLDRYPRYSPDGKKIAFVSLRSGNWQLWVSDSQGGNPVQMTSYERAEVTYPTWSADGKQIGFVSNAEGAYQAYVIDAAGGQARKLEAVGINLFGWNWSRDGRWIFFPSSRGGTRQHWKIPAGGGMPEQMTFQGSGGCPPVESPDGKLAYYARPGGVWSVPVKGGTEREVFAFDIDEGCMESSRLGIYFVANATVTKGGDLMFYPFPSGPITKVAGLETRYGLSISPDGRQLLYTKLTSTGSDLMLVDNFR